MNHRARSIVALAALVVSGCSNMQGAVRNGWIGVTTERGSSRQSTSASTAPPTQAEKLNGAVEELDVRMSDIERRLRAIIASKTAEQASYQEATRKAVEGIDARLRVLEARAPAGVPPRVAAAVPTSPASGESSAEASPRSDNWRGLAIGQTKDALRSHFASKYKVSRMGSVEVWLFSGGGSVTFRDDRVTSWSEP